MTNLSEIESLYSLFTQSLHVTTDSRKVRECDMFFALKGDNFDGNDYAAAALRSGATFAVVDRADAVTDPRCFLVDDALAALQQLAALHRRRLGLPIVAITGTNGKTTTKELVSAVLAKKYRVVHTVGNLNNHIGVPLTLLSLDDRTEIGVVEMGASARDEIAFSCSLAAPDYGLITNIGRAHLEGFGGVEGIRKGKGELYDALAARGGTAFVRADDAVLSAMAAERPTLLTERYDSSIADGVESRLVGDYNRFNIAAAIAVGRRFAVAEEDIRDAIAEYAPSNNRSQMMSTARNLLTVDCYNANPSSMAAAIAAFAAETHPDFPHRVLILGDMLELGAWSGEEHRRIVETALTCGAERIFLVGGNFGSAGVSDRRITLCNTTEELRKMLADQPLNGSFILVKGSHGVGLEKIIDFL